MNEKLIIYQKMYDLILYMFPILDKFPRKQKFVLSQQIENCMIDIQKLIIQANKSRHKIPHLFQIDVELEKLRLLIRLAKDLRFLSIKRYGNISKMTNEIGSLLGGWIKSQKG